MDTGAMEMVRERGAAVSGGYAPGAGSLVGGGGSQRSEDLSRFPDGGFALVQGVQQGEHDARQGPS
jgi:hypothetical protein